MPIHTIASAIARRNNLAYCATLPLRVRRFPLFCLSRCRSQKALDEIRLSDRPLLVFRSDFDDQVLVCARRVPHLGFDKQQKTGAFSFRLIGVSEADVGCAPPDPPAHRRREAPQAARIEPSERGRADLSSRGAAENYGRFSTNCQAHGIRRWSGPRHSRATGRTCRGMTSGG